MDAQAKENKNKVICEINSFAIDLDEPWDHAVFCLIKESIIKDKNKQ
jgi:hypothetical protein